MKYQTILSALVLTGLLGGCGETDHSQDQASGGEKSIMDSAMEKASEGATKLKEAATEMATVAQERGRELAAAAVAKTQELSAAAQEKAQEWLAQGEEYIREGKVDLAASMLEKLQAIEGSLPESIQTQVDQLQAMLANQIPEEGTGGAASADLPASTGAQPEAASTPAMPSDTDAIEPAQPETEESVPPQ